MSSSAVLCLITWILSYQIVVSEDLIFLDPPTIDKDLRSEITLELRSDFSSTCFSDYPITWKPFKGFIGSYNIEYQGDANERTYESTIHLTNISHHFVGHFYCVANSTQYDYDYSSIFDYEHWLDKSVSGLSKIYIFVNDAQHLLAPVDLQNGIAVLQRDYLVTLDYDYLIIPCKRTSERVTLLLLENSEKLHPEDFNGLGDKNGVVIRFSSVEEIYGRTFTCLGRREYSNSKILFSVRYNVPKIESSTGLYATKDEHLNLNCSIVMLKGETVAINWKLPNALLQEGRVDQSTVRTVDHPTRPYLQIGVSEISISDIDIVKDGGTYECEAIDELQIRSVDRIFIEILEKGDDTVDIHALDGIYKTEISRWRTVVWKVKYKGHPKPELEWYDTTGKVIQNRNKEEELYDYNEDYDEDYENNDSKYEVEINNQYAMLKIRFVRPQYSGYYTLKASNNFVSTEKKFELRVKVRPYMNVNDVVVRRNGIAKFVCNCTGYPLPTITWTFNPCDLREMEIVAALADCKAKHRSIEAKYFDTTSQSLTTHMSILVFNATETGIVKCTAVNIEGRGSIKANLHVTDSENELFGIWGLDDKTEIIAGDNVTVYCAVSVFAESYVKWFRNDERIESNDEIKVANYFSGYSREERISWTGIKTSHSGTYECHLDSYRRSPLVPSIKRLNITVYDPQKPEIDITIPTKDQIELRLSEPIRFTCNIVGHPLPKIQWYKNGELIKNGSILYVDTKTLEINATEIDDSDEFKCIGTNRFGSKSQFFNLKVTKEKSSNLAWIIGAIAMTLVVIICFIYAVLRFRKLGQESDTAINLGVKHISDVVTTTQRKHM